MKLNLVHEKLVDITKYDISLEFSDLSQAKKLYDRYNKREENKEKCNLILNLLTAIAYFIDGIFGILCLLTLFKTNSIASLFSTIWGRLFLATSVSILVINIGLAIPIQIPCVFSIDSIFNYKFALNILEHLNTATSFNIENKGDCTRITFSYDNDRLNMDIENKYITYVPESLNVVIGGYLEGNKYIITAVLPSSIRYLV